MYYCRGSYREAAWQKMGMVSSGLPEVWIADNTVPLQIIDESPAMSYTDLSPMPMADGSFLAISSRGGLPNVWRLEKMKNV